MSEVNEKLALMYEMARNAKASDDAITAKKYYDLILAEDPLNWEPVFYSVYFTTSGMKNGEIGNKTLEIKNCLNTVLLIVNKIESAEEKLAVLQELKGSVKKVAQNLHFSYIYFYNSLPASTRNPSEKISRAVSVGDLLFTMADALRSNGCVADAVDVYKSAITTLESESVFCLTTSSPLYMSTINKMQEAADYIRQTEPAYQMKRERPTTTQTTTNDTTNNNGCAIAIGALVAIGIIVSIISSIVSDVSLLSLLFS